MHSSRMRTGRSLTVSQSLLLEGGGWKAIPEGHNRRSHQKAITEDHFQPEGHLQSEGHQTRRPPSIKGPPNQKATPEGHTRRPYQKAITEGHPPPPGGSAPGGVPGPGGSGPEGSGPEGDAWSWGVSAPRGICSRGVSQHALRQTAPREQNYRQVQKYYLGHNFIAAGKDHLCCFQKMVTETVHVNRRLPGKFHRNFVDSFHRHVILCTVRIQFNIKCVKLYVVVTNLEMK